MNTPLTSHRSTSRAPLTLWVAVVLINTPTTAHAAPVGFTSTSSPVVVQDVLAELSTLLFDPTDATLTPIAGPVSIEFNNMGFRSTDRLLYAVQLNGSGLSGGNDGILQIDATGGIVNLGKPTGLPSAAGSRFDAGDISTDGSTMYITMGTVSNSTTLTPASGRLFTLDLDSALSLADFSTASVSETTITGDAGAVNDWAYNPADGKLYGGDQTHGQVAVLDPSTGVRTDTAVTGLPGGSAFGAAWFNPDTGNLFLYRNGGSIYEINPADNTLLNTWDAPGSTRNDGAFIAGAAVPLPTAHWAGCALLAALTTARLLHNHH